MELPRRCPSAQPADGDDDGRRFPDSTPPNAREPSPAPAQGDAVVAALARRREELLWELHKVKIRREMLMCELVETERAIAARYAAARQPPTPITPPLPWPQGDLLPAAPAAREYAWRGAPWEEQAHAALAARSGDQEHPWWRWSPSALRTPVYPHVERSSSPPMARGGLADDDQRQERGGPSGSPAMVPPVQPAPNVEHSTPLLGKEPAVVVAAEAVVQTVANADADQAFFGQGVTPGGRGVIGQQSKQGEIAVNGDAMLLLGQSTVSKSSEQPKPTESITGGQTDEHVQQRSQDRPAGQEIAEFEEQKRVDSNDELTPERRSSGVKRQLTAGTLPAKKPRSQKNYNCSLCKVSMTSPQELVEHRASLLHRSNLTPLQSGNKTNTTGEGSRKEEACRRAGASDHVDAADPGRKTANQSCLYFCEVCSVRSNSEKVMASHLAGKRHRGMMVQGRS